MHILDRMESFYSNKLHQKLRKLAEPLNTFYGLDTFCYSQMTPDGRFIQCSNHAEPNLFYFREGLCKYNPFLCHPDFYTNNQSIISAGFPDIQNQMAQKIVEEKYGLGNFLIIYKKEKDTAHVLLFSSKNTRLPLNTIFLNSFTTLNAFGDYFMQEWRPHLPQIDPYMIDAKALMGPIFHQKHPYLDKLPTNKEKTDFLAAIKTIDPRANTDMFSPQELRCIKFLLEGFASAKEIAQRLELSIRTVEHYLNNIKAKLGCYKKSELISRLNSFQKHGLIDTGEA